MAFDPTQPFELVDDKNGFDPSRPFEQVDIPISMMEQASAIARGARGDEVPRASGFLAQARDLPIQAFKGAGTGVRMLTDIFGANNPVSKAIAGYEDTMDAILSAESRQDSKEMSRILDEAKDKGTYDQVIAGLQAISKAPLETAFNVAGIAVPTLAAGAAGRALQLGKVGITAIGAGIGASQGAGNIKGQIYQGVVDELRNSGETDEEKIHNVASEAQAYNGKNLDQILIGAGLGAVAASTGAEKVLNRVIGGVGLKPSANLFANILKGGITEAVPEGFQGGQEQLAQNLALQRMGRDVPTMRGVVSQATMEAAAGAPLGGFGGAVEYYTAPKPPPIPKPPEVQEQEDIERQANIEASRLMTPTGDRNSEAVLNRIQQNEQAVENLRGSLSTLEPTSPGAASLRMEINARQDELATLRDLQIRLGREIAQATGVSAPIMEAPIAPTEPETPVTQPTPTEAPTEPTISEKPATSELVGAEPIAVVEQEQVATAEVPAITPAPVAETPAVAPAPEVAPTIEEQVLSIVPPETLAEIDKRYPNLSKLIRNNTPIWGVSKQIYLSERKKTTKITNAEIKAIMDNPLGQTPLQIENTLRSLLEEKKGTTKRKKLSQSEKNAIIEIIRNYTYSSFSEDELRQELSKMRKERANLNKMFEFAKKKGNTAAASEAMRKMRPLDDSIKRFNDARKEIDAIYTTPAVSETITPVEAAGISVGSRVKGKGPQTYIVEEVLTPSQREAELGEQFYLIRNERTGEVGRFESKAIKPVKAKGVRKMAARTRNDESLIVPEKDRYTFEEAQAEANKLFDGIPEGFVIVSDTTNPDYEFKAGYDIDNGNIIVNLAYIKKGESVRNLIAHELGHYAAGDPAIRAQLQAFLDGLPAEQRAKLERFVDRVYNKDTGEVRLEEKAVRAFVVMLKKGDNRNVFQKLLDTIKRWLNEKLGTKFQMTDMDAAAVLSGAVDRFRSGERIARQEEGIRKDTELSQMDNEYLDAVERGDSGGDNLIQLLRDAPQGERNAVVDAWVKRNPVAAETAQRMVDEAAKKAGYAGSDYRMQHSAPDRTSTALASIKTSKLVPSDYWENPQWYQSSPEDFESFSIVRDALNRSEKYTSEGKDGSSIAKIEVYRAVPKSVKEASIRNGDWVTPSKIYAQMEGKSIPEGYKIISQKVPLKKLWWDGNSIAELGFDDGQDYVYKNTKNNRKLLDPVTFDDAGNVIPLSQRFQKTSPDIRRAAVDRYDERSQVGGIPGVGAIKSTPIGIKAKTRDIVRTMFNSDTISQANTNRAWNLINRFAERNPESRANLSSLNQMVRESMADEASEEILQSIGGPTLQNELFSYAIKLAGQGDKKMLDHLLENPIVVSQGGTASTIGRDLGALGSFSSWLVNASQAERSATIEVLASRLFNTKSPTPEQIAAINTVLSAVKDTKINLGYAIEEEVKEVSDIIGTDIGEKIQSEIVESNPKLDPFAQAMLSLIQLQEAGEDIDFTVMVPARKEPKLSTKMEKMVRDALAKYQSKMGAKGATGLEATFWKTLSSQEEAVGPLADLDMASNRNLAKIVKEVLKKYGLVGTPPKRGEAGSEKLSDIQLVASILTNTPLSKEKVMRADAEITAEIERRYNEEKQAAAGDQTLLDAIEIKYNTLRQAWGEAMGNQLDIPVSEASMRRLLASEMKEKKIKLRDISDKPTLAGENQAKRDVVASVIKKMVELDPQADPNRFAEFEEKLNDIMDNMVATSKAKTRADTARQTVKDTANQPDRQAESAVRSLARMQGDVPDFGKAQPNEVRKIVSNDLRNAPDMGRKQAWKSMFVASLQQAGVSETIAMTLSDLVWRQHEINNLNKQIKQQEDAVTKGPISTIVDAILNTPLGEQQDPKWRENVILQYLVDAGIPSQRASNIAKLFDAAIAKRFAEAQTKAAQKAIAGLKTLDAESKRGFDKLFAAIRAQALNPASNPVREFAKQMGFKEFSGPQLQRLADLDTIINKDESTDAERARAVSEVQKIINEVALPPRVRDVLSSFYVGQALGRITTALIQVVDPAFYSATNAAISSFRNVTSPTQLGQIWGDYTTSLFRAFREFAFSFQNDINRSGKMVDFLETQDAALIRMNRQAQRDLESGNYAGFVKNTLFGTFPRFTFRTLKALDDAAFSILRDQSLNQYMVAAMNAAKIPKDKQIGVVRTALQAREIDRQNLLNQGMTKTEATVFSDERMKVYVQQALSGVGIPDVVGVVESAINDALSRIGKPRYATDPKTEKEQEIKDLGTLSYPLLKLYELTSQSANQMKGLEGEVYRIFVRTFIGFPVIASRVFNVAAGYTPLTLYRHLIKGRYPLSYGTALQRKQRLIEQFSLTLAVLPLLAMYRGSDDDDKKGTYVNFTGAGPSKLNKEFYAQWHKRNEPYSMQLVVDGKSRFTLDAKNSGPFSVMIYILGAYDDWSMNRRLKDEKTTKDDFRKAEEKMTWVNDMLGLLGTFILTSSRRGPTSSVMQGLVDWRRFPDNPLGALASEASFSLLPLVPIVGTGLAKNLSDLLSEPIDTTTLEGAIANNIPFVPQMLDKPALNGYGQKLGELQFAEKLKKSSGIPFTFVQFDNENDRKLTDITMKFGVGPSEVSRNDVEISLQRSLTDEEWRGFVKSYGEANAKMVLENYDQLYNMSREAFVYSLREAISPSAKLKAYTDLEKQREKK